jgi:uncharacterized membrane protein YfcA
MSGDDLGWAGIGLLATGGFVAGVVNAIAGGGSLVTVPMLVALGLPGTLANGTNRVAVLVQSVAGAWRFRAEGVSGIRGAMPVMVPLLAGSAAGALVVAQLPAKVFERLFGLLMLALLLPVLWPPREAVRPGGGPPWSPAASTAVWLAIGFYGGFFQAGVGLLLLVALSRAGSDLVVANAVKIVAVAAFTAVAVLVFVASGHVVWVPALVLSAGTAAGADVGARIAVRGGERVIRPVLAVCVVVLAGRMLGLW